MYLKEVAQYKFYQDKIKNLFSKEIQIEMRPNWVWCNEENGEYKKWYGNGKLFHHCFYKDGRLIKNYLEDIKKYIVRVKE
ncbi:MAG TPA: hypothetical protein PKI46_08830 [Bacteroidales bacterium]|nr:hypothetical protein [Bacteroidales bacterium]